LAEAHHSPSAQGVVQNNVLAESKVILAESDLILRARIFFCEREQGSENTHEPFSRSLRQGAWLILTVRASNEHSFFVRVPRAWRIAKAPAPLPSCASYRSARFGHAPGVE
jgi:hypothetical protein